MSQRKDGSALKKNYPKAMNTKKGEFKQLEKWIGHDLLVTSIMTLGKSTRGNCVFAKGIPPLQWKEFENKEERLRRPVPNPIALFPKPPTVEKKKEKKIAPKPISTPKTNQAPKTAHAAHPVLRRECKLFLIGLNTIYGQLTHYICFLNFFPSFTRTTR
jgi:hypothetical protein